MTKIILKDSINWLTELFKLGVSDKSKEIDPSNEEDWYSLTIGWAIGRGLDINEAKEFAVYIRYKTNLG